VIGTFIRRESYLLQDYLSTVDLARVGIGHVLIMKDHEVCITDDPRVSRWSRWQSEASCPSRGKAVDTEHILRCKRKRYSALGDPCRRSYKHCSCVMENAFRWSRKENHKRVVQASDSVPEKLLQGRSVLLTKNQVQKLL